MNVVVFPTGEVIKQVHKFWLRHSPSHITKCLRQYSLHVVAHNVVCLLENFVPRRAGIAHSTTQVGIGHNPQGDFNHSSS